MTKENPILVEATRGGRVESVHRGVAVVADMDGKVVWTAGDPDQICYPRSALKMFQALPVVAAGAAEQYGLSHEDHALLLASHSGEPAHTTRVAAMLEKMGLTMADLECGAHAPYHHETAMALEKSGAAPCPLHNNCSGKHSGMLMLALAMGAPHKNYIDPSHGVQMAIAKMIEKFCQVKLPPPGVDGCSAPTFALPMAAMAAGLARFGAGGGDEAAATRLLFSAAVNNPYFVAGTGRHCTAVMTALGGKALVKVGAEGFYAVVVPHLGLGAAIKIDDGAERASQLVLNGLLARLGLKADSLPMKKPITSFRGLPAGEMRVAKDIFSW